MFAIEISDKNLPEIIDNSSLTDAEQQIMENLADKPRTWYFVSGYIDAFGRYFSWTILPKFVLDARFDYDPIYASYHWDQIVRKS